MFSPVSPLAVGAFLIVRLLSAAVLLPASAALGDSGSLLPELHTLDLSCACGSSTGTFAVEKSELVPVRCLRRFADRIEQFRQSASPGNAQSRCTSPGADQCSRHSRSHER